MWKRNGKDIGVILSDDPTLSKYNGAAVASSKMVSQNLLTFKMKKVKLMVSLFKAVIPSRLEYYYA